MHTNGCGRLRLLTLAALSAVLICAGCALKPVAVTGEK
jgi:hypothetical protein